MGALIYNILNKIKGGVNSSPFLSLEKINKLKFKYVIGY